MAKVDINQTNIVVIVSFMTCPFTGGDRKPSVRFLS